MIVLNWLFPEATTRFSVRLCIFSYQVLQNYKSDPKISRFLQNWDLYVLPVLNVDGYIYSWENVSKELD